MKTQQLGYTLISTVNMMRRLACEKADAARPALTAMQRFFLGEIRMHELDGKEIYQKDLEAKFSIRRSTASGILSLMEQNGLLTRTPSPRDARLKTLHLTDDARKICEKHEAEVDSIERQITAGLTDAELEQLFSTMEKIRHNITANPNLREDTNP
jgi:DNA-binding MarR family transcriptional regulator